MALKYALIFLGLCEGALGCSHLQQKSYKNEALREIFDAFGNDRNTLIIRSGERSSIYSEVMEGRSLTIIDENSLNKLDKTKGVLNSPMIIMADSSSLSKVILPSVSDSNPKQRMLIILEGANSTTIEGLLRHWTEKFDLSRLYIVDRMELTKYNGSVIVCTYNKLTSSSDKHQKFTLNKEAVNKLTTFDRTRYRNWNKNKLRVIITDFKMVSKIDEKTFDPATLGYVDGETLRIFSKFLNFTIDFMRTRLDENRFGTRLPNGTVVGFLGLIENGHADLLAHGRPVIDYKLKNSVFIQPSRQMSYVFVLPRKSWREISILRRYFSFFDWKIYLIILAVTASLPVILLKIEKLAGCRSSDISAHIFTVISIAFSVTTKLPANWPSRWIIGSLALAFVVLSNLYASLTIEFFHNANKYAEEVRSIDELVKSPYEMKFIMSLTQLFQDIDEKYAPASHVFISQLIGEAWKRVERSEQKVFFNVTTTDEFIKTRRFAMLEPLNMAEELLGHYGDEITYIKDTPYVFYNAMLMRRNLPMLSEFSELQLRINEAGITEHQLKVALDDRDMLFIRRTIDGKNVDGGPQPFTLQQTALIFYTHLLFLAIASAVFLIEICRKV